MSSPFEVIASGVFGTFAGVLSGFLGLGGGAILAPLLVFALGFEQHRAQGISLAALLPPVGLPAVLAYRKAGVHIAVALVAMLVLGFVFGGFGGAWLAHRIPARELRWFFAAFLLISAAAAALSPAENGDHPEPVRSAAPPIVGLPIGLAAGVMSGLLGVGGGLVALPLLRRFGGLGRLQAQATTLAMMLPPIGLPAVYVYAREQGSLPWDLLGVVAIAFATGAGVGARLAGRVTPRTAALVYAGFMLVTAVLLLARG